MFSALMTALAAVPKIAASIERLVGVVISLNKLLAAKEAAKWKGEKDEAGDAVIDRIIADGLSGSEAPELRTPDEP